MAPPGGPRPGWSRRAQYGLFFSFLAAILGLLVGLAMLGLSLVAPKSYASVRGVALDATAPATGAMRGVTATIAGVFTGAGNYWDAASQNARLKAERRLMLQRIVEARAVLQENRELKAALQLRERSPQTIAAGRIVGSSFSSPRRYAILSVGGSDGVRVGMPVRSPEGMIGRVIDSGSLASRVLLVSDRASIIPTKLLRTGQPVISQGRGDGTVDLRPLEVGRNPFKKGDIVITSGTGGLYPPLVPVARVIRLDDDGAIAVPMADPGLTSFAIVQPPYEPAAVPEESAASAEEAP
jgi:rod shape-determining protein MreC